MRSIFLSTFFFALALFSGKPLTELNAQTVGVWYQPTPSLTGRIPHTVCGWIGDTYYKTFQLDKMLQTGGWGDWYKIYCKFDLEGMPQDVTYASMWFMPYARGDNSTPIGIVWYRVSSPWNSSLGWSSLSHVRLGENIMIPSPGNRWGGGITNTYNAWTSSLAQVFASDTNAGHDWRTVVSENNGILLLAKGNANNFNVFRSTEYNDYISNPIADGDRPGLYLEFPRPSNQPDFRMPLPGSTCALSVAVKAGMRCPDGTVFRRYVVTTETGGYDCATSGYDKAHQDVYSDSSGLPQFNYFGIDLAGTKYSTFTSTPRGLIPVLASADGFVDAIGIDGVNGNINQNGNYMVIRHWNIGTDIPGYSTLYLHMDPTGWPNKDNSTPWKVGDTIYRGDRIGYMGNTGLSFGTHLHFAIRYDDTSPPTAGTTKAGAKNIKALTNATMEGLLFKSYQTECNSSGTRIRFYPSSNRWYQ